MSVGAAPIEKRVRLRERIVVNTQYAIDKGGAGFFEVHLGSDPGDHRPVIYVTRDREIYRRALNYENDACRVDAWVINGRPTDTTAYGVLTQIRLAESNS